jgi:hypothetical protein
MAHEQTEKLGHVHFPIACSAPAQQHFDRAVALLHSFWYAEAVKAFTTVTTHDPKCTMGYWGIAMSLWYPLWQPPREAMCLFRGSDKKQRKISVSPLLDQARGSVAQA